MIQRLIFMVCLFFSTFAWGQGSTASTIVVRKKVKPALESSKSETGDYYPVIQWKTYDLTTVRIHNGTLPAFPGGDTARASFIVNNTRYKEEWKRARKNGKVIVDFTLDTLGRVNDASVKNRIGMGCDEEALRVVQSMPAWKPAMLTGKKVKVFMSLAVYFPPK
ncbi:MAG: energy transducer TonB [Bacteroidia bacterium]